MKKNLVVVMVLLLLAAFAMECQVDFLTGQMLTAGS